MTKATNRVEAARQLPRFRQYPDYKDSGIEWLGEIPAHWAVNRLGLTVTGCQNGVWGEEAEGTHDRICVRVADFDRIRFRVSLDNPTLRSIEPGIAETRRLEEGDLLLEKSGGGERQPVGAVVIYEHDEPAVCSNFVARMPVADGYHPRYLTYLHAALYAARINTRSTKQSTGIQNLDSSSYLRESVGLPNRHEQRVIADFLDRETAKIDALVANKERLIELLQEKRAALITRAVTRGLDPDAPMKDSGVEWLGQIPAHWRVKQLKWTIMFQRGHDLPSHDRQDGEVPVVTSSGVTSTHSRAVAYAPGIVTGRYGTIGQFYRISEDYWPLNTTLYSIDLRNNSPRFLIYMLRNLSSLFIANAQKSAVPGVDRNDIHLIQTAIPRRPEQRAIADLLDHETRKVDAVVSKINDAVGRLTELRIALVSAAVTGRIDVRGMPSLQSREKHETEPTADER